MRFRGPGSAFEPVQLDIAGAPQPGHVLVQIDLATICGSDLHTVAGRRTSPAPVILGHEGVGRIVASAREGWSPGHRVTWTLADSCGQCRCCRELNLPQKCDRLFKYGHAPCSDLPNGCYSTHIDLRPGTHLVRVPGELPDSVAAPANCALATMVAATEALPAPCNVAVIQGAGLLGIYGCALLRGKGVRRVIMVDTDPRRLELVPKFGGEPVLETARQRLSRGEADAVFEVAGVPAVIGDGLAVLRPGGFYGLVGLVHPQSALDITGEAIIRGCVTLRGFHNYAPRHLDAAIEFLRQEHKTFPWAELVSPPWPLARLDEAFAEAAGRRWHRVAVAP